MKGFFYPKRVAVVGVSNRPSNMGRAIVNNMIKMGFNGEVYPVGGKGGVILGRPIYTTLAEVPARLDMAVILTPAQTIPGIMEECGQAGIKRVVIEAAGFSEYSADRKDLEDQLNEIAAKYDIRFIGPNCIGIVNLDNGLATPFVPLVPGLQKSHVSVLAQSGGIALSYMNFLAFEQINYNKVTSVGNKLNVDENDLLEYLVKEDDDTDIICVYLEGLKDGRRLMDIARNSRKPILIHKSGTGSTGAQMAASHTAAMSSDDLVVDAAFKQAGIIRVHQTDLLIDFVKVLNLPPLQGTKLAVVSRSGGHAVIAADTCESLGFELPQFKPEMIKEIGKHVRASVINLRNPLDLGDLFDLKVYEEIIRQVMASEDIDGIILVHGMLTQEDEASRNFIHSVSKLCHEFNKPVALCLFADEEEIALLKKRFHFPIFNNPENGAMALDLSYRVNKFRTSHTRFRPEPKEVDKAAAARLLAGVIKEKRNPTQAEGFEILKSYGFEVPPFQTATTAKEAALAAEEVGFPAVLKVDTASILHKTDVGGVALDIASGEEAAKIFGEMKEKLAPLLAKGEDFRAMLMGQAPKGGYEVIFGAKQDNTFGPVVLFGLGGIYTEVFEDIAIRVAPLDRHEARHMIEEIRGYKLLQGARSGKSSDISALVEQMLSISQLAADFPEIRELDINPVRVYEKGCQVLDVRIIL